MARLRHVFRIDPATLNVFGVRCVHCGDRKWSIGHLGAIEELKYDWRFRGEFERRRGRWIVFGNGVASASGLHQDQGASLVSLGEQR